MNSKRVRAGFYIVTTEDGVFEIEKVYEGNGWHVFEQVDGYRGEYRQTYWTKTEAMESLSHEQHVRKGAVK